MENKVGSGVRMENVTWAKVLEDGQPLKVVLSKPAEAKSTTDTALTCGVVSIEMIGASE